MVVFNYSQVQLKITNRLIGAIQPPLFLGGTRNSDLRKLRIYLGQLEIVFLYFCKLLNKEPSHEKTKFCHCGCKRRLAI